MLDLMPALLSGYDKMSGDWSLYAPFPDIRTSPNTRLGPLSLVDFVPSCVTRILIHCCPVDCRAREIYSEYSKSVEC